MVTAAAHEEADFLAVIVKDRCDHGDVRQMCSAIEWIVQRHDVARFQAAATIAHDRADAFPHGPKVHGHVRRVGDQPARGIENRAGEVKPFFDINGQRCILQHRAGLLSHAHEQIIEQFK